MKTPNSTCPAAHSMDTEWFALDERGHVGVFFTGETGALPGRALASHEESLLPSLGGVLLGTAKGVKWRTRAPEDLYDEDLPLLVASTKPAFAEQVERGVLHVVHRGSPTVYATSHEFQDSDLADMLGDPLALGFLPQSELIKTLGFAEFAHDMGGGSGSYVRQRAPTSRPRLDPALKKQLASLTLPVDFRKVKRVALWQHMPENAVTVWESGLSFDGGAAEARAEAAEMRRFEFRKGASNKFWEVFVEGSEVVVRFGRIGTTGQSSRKACAQPDEAVAAAERLVSEKVKKGYELVTAQPSEPRSSRGVVGRRRHGRK